VRGARIIGKCIFADLDAIFVDIDNGVIDAVSEETLIEHPNTGRHLAERFAVKGEMRGHKRIDDFLYT
jgi:hypothetical protein